MKRRLLSFRYAWEGFVHAIRSERNMQIHIVSAAAAVVLGMIGRLTAGEWLWIALAIALVWSAECFNTAIERLTDLYGAERHPLAKAAKDTAAAAVLITAVFAGIVGAVVLLPAVIQQLGI